MFPKGLVCKIKGHKPKKVYLSGYPEGNVYITVCERCSQALGHFHEIPSPHKTSEDNEIEITKCCEISTYSLPRRNMKWIKLIQCLIKTTKTIIRDTAELLQTDLWSRENAD